MLYSNCLTTPFINVSYIWWTCIRWLRHIWWYPDGIVKVNMLNDIYVWQYCYDKLFQMFNSWLWQNTVCKWETMYVGFVLSCRESKTMPIKKENKWQLQNLTEQKTRAVKATFRLITIKILAIITSRTTHSL